MMDQSTMALARVAGRASLFGMAVLIASGSPAHAQGQPSPAVAPTAAAPAANMPAPPSAQQTYDLEALSVGLDEEGDLAFFEGTAKLPIPAESFYQQVGRSDLSSGAWWRTMVRDYASEVGWGVGIAAVVAAVTIFAFGGQFFGDFLPAAPTSLAGVPFGDSLPVIGAIVVVGGIGAALGAAIGFGAPLVAQEPPMPELQKMATTHNRELATRLGLNPDEVDLYASSVGTGVPVVGSAPPGPAAAAPLAPPRREDDFMTRDVEDENTVRVALIALSPDAPELVEKRLAASLDAMDDVRGVPTRDKPYAQEPLKACGTAPVCLSQVAATMRSQIAVGYAVVAADTGVFITLTVVDRKGRVLSEQTVNGADITVASGAAARSLTSLLAPLSK